MQCIKLIAILFLWLFFFVVLALVHLWISVFSLPDRWKIISRWMRVFTRSMRAILNIKVTVQGAAGQLGGGGDVIISNHFGYLDGIILGSLIPVIFVSKREVKSWPLVGQWTTLCGTVFVNRKQKDQVVLLVAEMTRKLKDKTHILLFPEGHATNGERMLPFQTAPLAAPLRNRSIIVPVTLVYKSVDDKAVSKLNRDLIYCYDDMAFLPHFWKLLSLRSIEAIVTVQPKIECSRYDDNSAGRKRLAADCYSRVLGRRANFDLYQEVEEGRERLA